MIAGLPLQTQSTNKSLVNFGCKIYVDLACLQDKIKKVFSPDHYLKIFDDGVNAGLILDNDIPITKEERKAWEEANGKPCPEWYRAFMLNPEEFIKRISGLTYRAIRGTITQTPPIEYDYIEIEWATAGGSHFTCGEFNSKRELIISYNPDPTVRLLGIRTIRYIKLS